MHKSKELPRNMYSTLSQETVLGSLRRFQKEGLLTDVLLNVGGTKLKAHKVVLAANSEYFQARFLGTFSEIGSDELTISTPIPIFQKILDLLYGQRIFIQDSEEGRELILALSYYQIDAVDPLEYIKAIKVPTDSVELRKLFEFTDKLFPEDQPPEVLEIVVSKMSPQTNLDELSDDSIVDIMKLLDARGAFERIDDYYNTVVRAIQKGHSNDLLNLFNYKRLPDYILSLIPQEYHKSMTGPIPTLDTDIWNRLVKNNHISGIMLNRMLFVDDGTRVVDGDNIVYRLNDGRYGGVRYSNMEGRIVSMKTNKIIWPEHLYRKSDRFSYDEDTNFPVLMIYALPEWLAEYDSTATITR